MIQVPPPALPIAVAWKSGCPLSISYCPPSIVNSRLTPCHYLFADDMSFVYCLLSTVSWLLFVTHYPLLYETLTSIIEVSYSARLLEPIDHCACQIYWQITCRCFQINKMADFLLFFVVFYLSISYCTLKAWRLRYFMFSCLY